MKHDLIFKSLLLVLFFPFAAKAQNFHFATRVGMAVYQGDLKKNTITISQPGLMGSIGARYDLSEKLTARTYLSYGTLRADDKKGSASMQSRNLNFKTRLIDFELGAQYSLFSLNDRWWTPYVFAGIGLYHFKPFTEDTAGTKTFLKPLSTEGQGFLPGVDEYKLTQFAVPLGIGVQYALNEDLRIGLEFGYRKIFTDYIDDVSTVYADKGALLSARGQTAVDLAWRGDEITGAPYPVAGAPRGNAGSNDGYYFFGITFTSRYFFDKYKEIAGIPIGSGKQKRVGCPSTRY